MTAKPELLLYLHQELATGSLDPKRSNPQEYRGLHIYTFQTVQNQQPLSIIPYAHTHTHKKRAFFHHANFKMGQSHEPIRVARYFQRPRIQSENAYLDPWNSSSLLEEKRWLFVSDYIYIFQFRLTGIGRRHYYHRCSRGRVIRVWRHQRPMGEQH